MRVWLYARLSNDDDRRMNSLDNQLTICRGFAEEHNHIIVGQSEDDNVSGMKFSRRGIEALMVAVEGGKIDAVIVKDLARLGRHKTQTALFIDYLRERGVRVLSVTEGLDTALDEDDLVIGVRGLMNDSYARDIGKKVRAGYLQKQKEGIVIIPPFGYWKEKNTGENKVEQEAAETVGMIYSLYLEGLGLKEIARQLNEGKRKTPAQMQMERYGKQFPNLRSYHWTYTSVKNILREESYTGVLINRRRVMKDGKVSRTPEEQQLRHEGVYPVLICRERWEEVQRQLKRRSPRRPEGSNKPRHRYTGLLCCKECGSPFVPLRRSWKGRERVEYICKGYHRNGKSICSSHRIHEETLDALVWEHLEEVLESRKRQLKQCSEIQKMWALRKPILDAHILSLQEKVEILEQEIDEIIMESLRSAKKVK